MYLLSMIDCVLSLSNVLACISCSCSLPTGALKAILPQFVPRMANKWDSIGIQLAQAGRVSQLRNSPEPNEMKMQDILDAWISADHLVPWSLFYSLSDILRSSDVGLHDVAKDLVKVCRLHAVCSGWDAHALGSRGG